MVPPGEYSDTLRALGWFLSRTEPTAIEIADLGDRWLVASSRGSETLFETFQLEDLRVEGRLRRGIATGEPGSHLSEHLRTLGHLLDALHATNFTICQVPEGFRLTAKCQHGRVRQTFSLDQINGLAARQRQARVRPSRPAGAGGQSTTILTGVPLSRDAFSAA